MGRGFNGPVGRIIALDRAINRSLARLRTPLTVQGAKLVSLLGSGPLWAAAYTLLVLACKDPFRPLIHAVLTGELIQLSITIPLRYLTRRERPQPDHAGRLFADWNRYSFPSLHTSRVCLLAIAAGSYWHGAAPYLPAGAVIIIGFSRLLLEKHYLSDVLAGAALGAFAGATALWLNT
ncbi:MAG: phosphatase PAP2 family protein [Pseudomonadota bacterium]